MILSEGRSLSNSIRDCAPDAWGRRVITNKILGQKGKDADTADLSEMTYLLESGSIVSVRQIFFQQRYIQRGQG
jgi:serine/threonine-protein kinase HipA